MQCVSNLLAWLGQWGGQETTPTRRPRRIGPGPDSGTDTMRPLVLVLALTSVFRPAAASVVNVAQHKPAQADSEGIYPDW